MAWNVTLSAVLAKGGCPAGNTSIFGSSTKSLYIVRNYEEVAK
jgi:hypothetical protein